MNRSLRAATLFLFVKTCLFADGGTVLLRKQSGPFVVTVFGSLQVGTSDVSVLVQNAGDQTPVMDATVWLQIDDSRVLATHTQATNKLLYAAPFMLAKPGKTQLQVTVTSQGKTSIVDGNVEIAPQAAPIIAYWPYFALLPLAVLLFMLNQWLKNKRKIRRLEGSP